MVYAASVVAYAALAVAYAASVVAYAALVVAYAALVEVETAPAEAFAASVVAYAGLVVAYTVVVEAYAASVGQTYDMLLCFPMASEVDSVVHVVHGILSDTRLLMLGDTGVLVEVSEALGVSDGLRVLRLILFLF